MKPGFVRIIGGDWRGRRIQVPDVKDLRPTPDRVRETLFNWLSPYIAGARCLDLFAGSGALGLEAASRGASCVVMMDESRVAIDALKIAVETVKANNITLLCGRVPDALPRPEKPFDIVFLDPPYQSGLLTRMASFLEENHFLADNAHIYLEASAPIKDNELPSNWRMIKNKQAGQVFYHLALREKK